MTVLTREMAETFAGLALSHISREFPYKMDHVLAGDEDEASYPGELFLMVAGALFLALNMAPTEEMILIAYRMSPIHVAALLVVSIWGANFAAVKIALIELPPLLLCTLRFVLVAVPLVLFVPRPAVTK